MKIRIIGDVHGKTYKYKELIREVDYSIQLGDFGFKLEWGWLHKNIDPTKHKIIPGNHDSYPFLTEHSLGNYGSHKIAEFEFFFIRGAGSIDECFRHAYIDWWPEEEMEYKELSNAFDLYESKKPDVVLTHTPPDSMKESFPELAEFRTRTGQALSFMFERHEPKLWLFGHIHKNLIKKINNTTFVSLSELNFIDYNTEFDIYKNIKDLIIKE